jgi:hypothetical protein
MSIVDRVHHQQTIGIGAQAPELRQRRNPAGVKGHPRHRQQPAPLAQLLLDDLGIDAAVGLGESQHLDAPALERQPRRDVGGELLLSHQHLVALLPVHALGDQRQALGGGADDRYVVRLAAHQLAAEVATGQVVGAPLAVLFVAGVLLVGDALPHRLGNRAGQRTHRRVVQVQALLADRKLRQPASEVECHDGIIVEPNHPLP